MKNNIKKSFFLNDNACLQLWPSTFFRYYAHHEPEEIFNVDFWANIFGRAVDKIIGSAWIGYADTMDFSIAETRGARLLDRGDDAAFHRLAESCSQKELEHSGIKFDRPPILGCFLKDEIVAVAGYEIWGKRIAHVGVITHPSYRGRGYGKAVVSAITEYGLSKGLIMQYRTLQSNMPSVVIARSLGYQEYAETIAVRLTEIRI